MRSKYVFLILACVYAGIAVGGIVSAFSISESVLLGLSVSSALISLADGVNNFCRIKALGNDYDYSLFVASEFLQSKIDGGLLAISNFDLCNLKYGIDMLRNKPNPMHPAEYGKKKLFKCGNFVSTVFFIVGIASFILIPFSKITADGNASKYVTIIAFAFMCGNLFFDDRIAEIQHNKYLFDSDKQSLISSLFPEYMNEYINRTQHVFQYAEIQKKNEELERTKAIKEGEVKKDGHHRTPF